MLGNKRPGHLAKESGHGKAVPDDAARVTALLQQRGVSQSGLAKLCEIQISALGRWLNGMDTGFPGVVVAGKKAMQWYEENKGTPHCAEAPQQQVQGGLPNKEPDEQPCGSLDAGHHWRNVPTPAWLAAIAPGWSAQEKVIFEYKPPP